MSARISLQETYSDAQVVPVTTPTNSTNSVHHGPLAAGNEAKIEAGEPLYLEIFVAAGATATTMQIIVETDDDNTFGSATNVLTLQNIPVTSAAGRVLKMPLFQHTNPIRAVTRIRYTLTGGGATITSHLVNDAQDLMIPADARSFA